MGNRGLACNCEGTLQGIPAFLAGNAVWRQFCYRTGERQFQGTVRAWEQAGDCISAVPHPCEEIARDLPCGGAGEEHFCVAIAFCQTAFSQCCA